MKAFRGERRAEPLGGGDQLRPRFQAVQSVLQISGHVIEADAPEAHGRFVLATGVRDDHDGMLAVEHGSGPGGILPAQADVDAARQMRRGKFAGIARIEDLRANPPASRARRQASMGFTRASV